MYVQYIKTLSFTWLAYDLAVIIRYSIKYFLDQKIHCDYCNNDADNKNWIGSVYHSLNREENEKHSSFYKVRNQLWLINYVKIKWDWTPCIWITALSTIDKLKKIVLCIICNKCCHKMYRWSSTNFHFLKYITNAALTT